jgi:TolA-binding protein
MFTFHRFNILRREVGMTRILSGVFSIFCVVGVSGLSMAGTTDGVQGQTEERNRAADGKQDQTEERHRAADGVQDQSEERDRAANESQQREISMEEAAENIKKTQKERAIEAQRSTQQEAGGIVDQLREGAKGEVNQRSESINSTIDNLGR